MRVQHFGSVKVTYFDSEAVWLATRELANEIGSHFPEVDRVLVFGSLARGDVAPGSDVDLLLILSASDLTFLDRPARYHPEKFPVGLDIFAYTQAELEAMLNDNNFFVRRALREGVPVFERAPGQ
jgi:predicted nucleotidyltransferase